jgi:CMP-N,N'-diacetyllegionaminic acid synthase
MKIFVDIDQTICQSSENLDYSGSIPILENISKINDLYEEGHTIIYWTARGTVTGKDWRDLTEQQFKNWGIKYHEIRFGKPDYDLFICDKAVNSLEYFKDL